MQYTVPWARQKCKQYIGLLNTKRSIQLSSYVELSSKLKAGGGIIRIVRRDNFYVRLAKLGIVKLWKKNGLFFRSNQRKRAACMASH